MANDFLKTYTPLANDIATQTGLDPSVVLGIIDLETGSGQHVSGNNIFGISPGGKVAGYPDVETGARAFVDLMKSGRYAGVAAAGDPAAQAQALVKSGYNTVNPNYAAIITRKAAGFGSQLGYQDNPPGGNGAAPAGAKDQVLTELGGDQKPPPATTAPQSDAGKPKSAKDQLQEELSQSGTSAAQPELGSESPIEPPQMPAGPVSDPVGEAVVRVAKAGIEAAKQPGPDVFGPATGFWQQLNPGINALAAGARGVGAAGLQAIYEVGEPVGKAINIPTPWGTIGGPGLGGDLATMAQVAPAAVASPFAASPSSIRLAGETTPTENALSRFTPAPTYVSPPEGENLLSPKAAEYAPPRTFPPPSSAIPEEPPPGGGAQPAGAMVTPYAASRFTPQEEQAYRTTAEGQKLMENQTIGEPDRNQYIPGVTANAAEQEQTASMARDLKALGLKSPEITQDIKEAAQRNDAARREYLMDTAKSPVDTDIVRTNRQDAIEADSAKVFAEGNVKSDVSTQPLLDQIDEALNKRINRRNDAMQQELRELRGKLVNPDGTAQTMHPEEAWGLRQQLDRMTDPLMKAEKPNLHYVGHELNGLADTLDQQINNAAPGYDGMIAKYKEFSRQIREQELLQKAERQLGSAPTLRFSDMQRFMKNVIDSRATSSRDLNPYKSLSDETMQRLWALRDDLRRSASASELARAPGSDTVPNILDVLRKHAGEAGLQGVAHLVGSAFGMPPGTANLVLGAGRQAMRPFFDARREAVERARAQGLLYPPTNPLNQSPLP